MGVPNFLCDGVPLQHERLDLFATQLQFLNNILKCRVAGKDKKLTDKLSNGQVMTRAQIKATCNRLQHALSGNFGRNKNYNQGCENYSTTDDKNDKINPRKPDPIINYLPDNYLCEGSPGAPGIVSKFYFTPGIAHFD